jgi:hypothetical protein
MSLAFCTEAGNAAGITSERSVGGTKGGTGAMKRLLVVLAIVLAAAAVVAGCTRILLDPLTKGGPGEFKALSPCLKKCDTEYRDCRSAGGSKAACSAARDACRAKCGYSEGAGTVGY